MKSIRLALALLLTLVPALPVVSLEPEYSEVIVVNGRVWDGYAYRETFVPSANQSLTLIEGRDSAITFVETLEYYWPLSRQVYVDFERQRDVLEGELVITSASGQVIRMPSDTFSILYPDGAINGNGQLLWGEEAAEAHADHRATELAFNREYAAARQAQTAYERQLLESRRNRVEGEPPAIVEPPPPLPQPSLRLVTAPQPGFRISLEPGDYTMVLEVDGTPVSGTKRKLRIIPMSGAATIVADVVPEERWTRPIPANAPSARIFARPGATFYVTLTEADRFAEEGYLPVISPQADYASGRSMWVRRRPATLDQLQLTWDGASPLQIDRGPLKVDQTGGASFGYRVRAAQEGETVDLHAFSIPVPADPPIVSGTFTALHDSGELLREIVVVQPRNNALALALAIVPMAFGLVSLALRLRRNRPAR